MYLTAFELIRKISVVDRLIMLLLLIVESRILEHYFMRGVEMGLCMYSLVHIVVVYSLSLL